MSAPAPHENSLSAKGLNCQADISHYDVEIDPVVKVANQKKPKDLLRAVWEQLAVEAQGAWKPGFDTIAYDGRKNAYTPFKLPIEGGQSSLLRHYFPNSRLFEL